MRSVIPRGNAPRWPRVGLTWLVPLVLLVGITSDGILLSATAQTDDADTPTVREARTPFFRRIGIAPIYGSSVDINRTATRWDQTLDLEGRLGPVRAENDWRLGVQENSAQNNYKQRAGKGLAKLAYDVERFGGWSTGLQFDWRRTFTKSDFLRTVNNGGTADLFVSSEFPTALLRPLVDEQDSTRTASWNVISSLGKTWGTDLRQSRSRGEGNPLQRSDSTATDGIARDVESRLHLDAARGVSLDFTGALASTREDSKTVSRDVAWLSPDSVQVIEAPNRSSSRRASARAAYRPTSRFEWVIDGRASRDRGNYFSTLTRSRESRKGLDDRLEVRVAAEPIAGVMLDLSALNQTTDLSYEVDTNDRGKKDSNLSGTLEFKTGQRFGPLRDLEITTEATTSNGRFTFERSSDYDNENRRLKASVRRSLGKKVATVVTGETVIDRLLYDDGSQDRDELRQLADASLGYRPTSKAETRVSFQFTNRQLVNIPAAKSINNLSESIYRIEAELTYKLRETIKLNQRYSISAIASEFDFNEDDNQLSRTSEVRTRLSGSITPRVTCEVAHDYRFRDSGSFERRQGDGVWLYGRATTENYNNFVVRTVYNLTPWFDLHANQRMEVRENKTLVSSRVTRTEKLDFTGGTTIQHTLNEGLTVDANADWTQTSSEKPYWKINFRTTVTY